MSNGTSIRLEFTFGVAPKDMHAANVTLPRIAPAPRRSAARIAVRWTLTKGAAPRSEARTPRSA